MPHNGQTRSFTGCWRCSIGCDYEEIRGQLQRKRTRTPEHLLPARFAMAGDAQVFPVAVEVRIPDGPLKSWTHR